MAKDQIIKGLVTHGKELLIFSKYNGWQLDGFKQRNDNDLIHHYRRGYWVMYVQIYVIYTFFAVCTFEMFHIFKIILITVEFKGNNGGRGMSQEVMV